MHFLRDVGVFPLARIYFKTTGQKNYFLSLPRIWESKKTDFLPCRRSSVYAWFARQKIEPLIAVFVFLYPAIQYLISIVLGWKEWHAFKLHYISFFLWRNMISVCTIKQTKKTKIIEVALKPYFQCLVEWPVWNTFTMVYSRGQNKPEHFGTFLLGGWTDGYSWTLSVGWQPEEPWFFLRSFMLPQHIMYTCYMPSPSCVHMCDEVHSGVPVLFVQRLCTT